MRTQPEQQLIDAYIDSDTDRYHGGRADARLRRSGVSVWAIVAYLPVYQHDLDQVAEHFGITHDEVEAALAYYERNKAYIDARLVLNEG